MKGWRWTLHEMKLQWKNGLYFIYILVTLLYILLLGYVPEAYKGEVAILLVVSDPTFLGMIFVGGILLLEKNQGIPKGIGISPLGSKGYIFSKVISLLVITLLTSICLMKVGYLSITFVKGVGLMLGASLFTLLGIIIGSFARNTNDFMFWVALFVIPFALPVLSFFFFKDFVILHFIPTYTLLELLSDIPLSLSEACLRLAYLGLWFGGTFVVTQKIVEERIFVR